MAESGKENSGAYDAFVRQYWADKDADGVRPLWEYLKQFPGADDGISREYQGL